MNQQPKAHTEDEDDCPGCDPVPTSAPYDDPISALRGFADSIGKNKLRLKETKPGAPSQYSVYGPGYKPVQNTIPTLPPGVYDIGNDQTGVFAVPAIKPSGLLLELPEMRSDHVLALVDRFWASEKDYKEGNEFINGGAAYKAGIMLIGPPGSGKSCTIKLVTNKLIERGGTVFNANHSPDIITTFIKQFAQVEPNRKSIIILEDIDGLIETFGEDRYLSMLDSADSVDNVMFIATTNYPHKLNPRVYNRPGRFSHIVKIDMPTAKARDAFLRAVLKNHRDVDYIVQNTEGFSVDHLSALLSAVYREKKELKEELLRLKNLYKLPKADAQTNKLGIGE